MYMGTNASMGGSSNHVAPKRWTAARTSGVRIWTKLVLAQLADERSCVDLSEQT
jgi:hypothetical protein